MNGAIVGGALSFVTAAGLAVGNYYVIEMPTLEETRATAAREIAARKRADERADAQQKRADDLQRRTEETARQLAVAKSQFVPGITQAVDAARRPIPGGEPGRPVLLTPQVVARELVPRARRIVDMRDRARSGIQSISLDLTRVYNELDSDIDEAKRIIDNPPVDPGALQAILARIAASWPTKLKLIDEIAENTLRESKLCALLYRHARSRLPILGGGRPEHFPMHMMPDSDLAMPALR